MAQMKLDLDAATVEFYKIPSHPEAAGRYALYASNYGIPAAPKEAFRIFCGNWNRDLGRLSGSLSSGAKLGEGEKHTYETVSGLSKAYPPGSFEKGRFGDVLFQNPAWIRKATAFPMSRPSDGTLNSPELFGGNLKMPDKLSDAIKWSSAQAKAGQEAELDELKESLAPKADLNGMGAAAWQGQEQAEARAAGPQEEADLGNARNPGQDDAGMEAAEEEAAEEKAAEEDLEDARFPEEEGAGLSAAQPADSQDHGPKPQHEAAAPSPAKPKAAVAEKERPSFVDEDGELNVAGNEAVKAPQAQAGSTLANPPAAAKKPNDPKLLLENRGAREASEGIPAQAPGRQPARGEGPQGGPAGGYAFTPFVSGADLRQYFYAEPMGGTPEFAAIRNSGAPIIINIYNNSRRSVFRMAADALKALPQVFASSAVTFYKGMSEAVNGRPADKMQIMPQIGYPKQVAYALTEIIDRRVDMRMDAISKAISGAILGERAQDSLAAQQPQQGLGGLGR